MRATSILFLCFTFVICLLSSNGQKFSQRRRRSKEIEERINNLDEGTKKRIHAMKASGMPKDAIADKISYISGGKNVAKRIVDALHDEPATLPKKKPINVNKPKNTGKTNNKRR